MPSIFSIILVELATLVRTGTETKMNILKNPEVTKLIETHEKLEKEEEARKKKENEAKPGGS